MDPEFVPKEADIDREIGLRGKLYDFMEMSWSVVEPDQPFVGSWSIGAMAEHYEACFRGEIDRLVVNVPPGCTKSRTTCVFFPTWCWIKDPGLRWLFGSFDIGLTTRDAEDSLELIQSPWFRARWPDKIIIPKTAPVQLYENQAGGWRMATSVNSKATGWHPDFQVIDDPIKPQGMSAETLGDAKTWLSRTLSTRWRKPGKECRILIMQRLHSDDPAAHMIVEGAVHLCLPMEYDPKRHCHTRWAEDKRTEKGELLVPLRYNKQQVATMRKELGPMDAAAQLDQDPIPEGGVIFKKGSFKFYKEKPAKFSQLLASWDCAFKETSDTDFVVGQVWGRIGGEYYLLDQVRGRMSFTETCAAIKAMKRKWPRAMHFLIEDKANGPAVVDTLKKEVSGLIEITPEGGKVARANACSGLVEAGNVYLPDPSICDWIDEFIAEITRFPLGKNDDQVDAMTQALNYMHKKRSYLEAAMKKLGRELSPED